MFRHTLCFTLVLCLLACGIGGPPQQSDQRADQTASKLPSAPLLEGAQNVQIGSTTLQAVEITSGYSLATTAGQVFTFFLAPKGEQTEVHLEAANQAQIQVPSQTWTRVQVQATGPKLELQFAGGPLYLSQPHLSDPGSPKTPNLLLISIDTLRADRFSPAHMPKLYKIFSEGRIFDKVFSSAPWTLPSQTSLLTSLYPAVHGVRTPKSKLSSSAVTLADHMRELGYFTAAVTEDNYVSARYGLSQGFLYFEENHLDMLSTDSSQMSKLDSTLGIIRKLDQGLEALPRFYFLHTFEVHCPYVPHGEEDDPEHMGHSQWLIDHDNPEITAEQLQKISALYDGEAAYTDQLLSVLVEEFLAQGNWLIVLTADHGDEFGEHQGLLHGDSVHAEVISIPLAMVGVGLGPEAPIEPPYSIVDVAPTALARLGLPRPASFGGRDLFDPHSEKRAVFSESYYLGRHIPTRGGLTASVVRDNYHFIHFRNFGEHTYYLYDLEKDPLETQNMLNENIAERNSLAKMLQQYLALKPGRTDPVGKPSAEELETMRSLGYIK